MRISDWSSDVCSSDLRSHRGPLRRGRPGRRQPHGAVGLGLGLRANIPAAFTGGRRLPPTTQGGHLGRPLRVGLGVEETMRSPHKSEAEYKEILTALGRVAVSISTLEGIGSNLPLDRKSVGSGKSVTVRFDLGCRSLIKNKTKS